MPEPKPQHDHLPAALADDLADLFDARVLVPREVDDAVAAAVRAHLGSRARRSQRPWLLATAGLAAACLAGLLVLPTFFASQEAPEHANASHDSDNLQSAIQDPESSAPLPGDIDGSGSIDILDAYHLARRIKSGSPADDFDLTHDGRVDDDDVHFIATRAVALNGGAG